MRRRFREHCIERHGLNPGDTERLCWFELERLTLTLLNADAAAFSQYTIQMARVAAAKLRSLPQRTAAFIEPMECLAVAKLPDAPGWVWEIKLDGYRAIAVKDGTVALFSRRKKSLAKKFPYIVDALAGVRMSFRNRLPDGRTL
jgi:ATP-dependent DNA ligase